MLDRRVQDERVQEGRVREQRVLDERVRDQRVLEQRVQDERVQEGRVRDQRVREEGEQAKVLARLRVQQAVRGQIDEDLRRAATDCMLVAVQHDDGANARWARGELWAATQHLRRAADVLRGYTARRKTRGDALRLLAVTLEAVTATTTRLATAARRNWRHLHRLRLVQRVLMVHIIGTSGRRGARKLRGEVSTDMEELRRRCEADVGGVYVRVHAEAHRWRYVGQTR